MTWSIEGSLSPACVRERVKSLPHASSLKSKRWPLKEEASSCARLETASKSLDVDQSYGGWPALQHPPNFRSCNIEAGRKNRSKTSPSSSQSWQTAKCVANKRLELLLYEVAWLHNVSRAQAHACKSGAKVARFRAPDSTYFRGYDMTEWKILQGRSLFNPVLYVDNTLLCKFQRLCTYFQDTGVLYLGACTFGALQPTANFSKNWMGRLYLFTGFYGIFLHRYRPN